MIETEQKEATPAAESPNEDTPLLQSPAAAGGKEQDPTSSACGQSDPLGGLEEPCEPSDQGETHPAHDESFQGAPGTRTSNRRRHPAGSCGVTMSRGLSSSSDQHNPVRRLCCNSYGGPIGFWVYLSNLLSYPVFVLPFQVLFLSIPISSIYFSLKYRLQCPANADLPVMILIFGVLATYSLISRIGVTLWKKCSTSEATSNSFVKVLHWMLDVMAALSLAVGTYETYITTPSPDEKSTAYCHPVFYSFIYWMSWTTLGIVLFCAILHLPRKLGRFNLRSCV